MRVRFPIIFFTLLLSAYVGRAQEIQKIFTLAGDGSTGFSGDGGTAPAAELDGPLGVSVDSSGNVFIVDYYNFRVRKVVPSGFAGTITTIAGNGTPGYTGDGTIATEVEMIPHDIALDRHANIYISDEAFSVIRRVDHNTQLISTVVGNGHWGYSGDSGLAKYATLRQPYGMAVDKIGNLYIADAGNHAIRKVDTAGFIYTIAGNGTPGYSGNGPATTSKLDSPYAVAVDRWGTLYINDYDNNVIRKLDTFNNISLVAGTQSVAGYTGDLGPATAATLNNAKGIAVDTFGNLYIADADNNVIRMVNATTGIITTVVGNGTVGFGGDLSYVTGCNLHNPYGVAVDVFGSIYIADANNQRLRKTYSPWLGVHDVVTYNDIEVYPNPFTDQFTVTGCSISDRISVTDITGRQVGADRTISNGGSQSFDFAGLSTGLYVLQVSDASGLRKAVLKLVKE